MYSEKRALKDGRNRPVVFTALAAKVCSNTLLSKATKAAAGSVCYQPKAITAYPQEDSPGKSCCKEGKRERVRG